MKERIQKILAARGIASRRASEEMICAGRVTCNGVVCKLGDSADPDADVIALDGVTIPAQQEYVYLLLNKPKGYVTTMSDEKGRKNVSHLVQDCPQRVYPVGRLDMDSEGLLIMTNNGQFANKLMHPRHMVDKTYLVSVKGFSPQALARLKLPIILDGYRIREPQVKLIDQQGQLAQLEVTIHEGRNRQVRRMCAAAGMAVTRLIRISEGTLALGDLPAGRWRYLTVDEISALQ